MKLTNKKLRYWYRDEKKTSREYMGASDYLKKLAKKKNASYLSRLAFEFYKMSRDEGRHAQVIKRLKGG